MKINKENKITFVVAAVVAAGLLFNVILRPHIEQYRAVKTQYFSQEDLVKVREVKKGEMEKYRDSVESWEEKAKSLKNKFLRKEDMTIFFKKLDKLAKKNRVKIYSMDPLEKKNNNKTEIEEMLVKINAAGTYVGIMNFSKEIFDDEKFIKIDDMQITSGENEGPGILEISMMLTLYIN